MGIYIIRITYFIQTPPCTYKHNQAVAPSSADIWLFFRKRLSSIIQCKVFHRVQITDVIVIVRGKQF